MTKQEFLRELRLALQGQMSQTAINENIRYYDNYIVEETHKGSNEEDVVSRLGNPRLIAKTLIGTADMSGTAGGERYFAGSFRQAEAGGSAYADDSRKRRFRWLTPGSWYARLSVIAAVILLIIIVANVIAFLLPLLVPIVMIILIYSLFMGNRR